MAKKPTMADRLPRDVYNRLANCRSTKADLPALVAAQWAVYMDGGIAGYFTKEDALCAVLELLDCNGVFIDLTREEYDDLIS